MREYDTELASGKQTEDEEFPNISRRLRFYLSALKYRQTGSDPKLSGYAYAEIPEWALRQMLEDAEILESKARGD